MGKSKKHKKSKDSSSSSNPSQDNNSVQQSDNPDIIHLNPPEDIPTVLIIEAENPSAKLSNAAPRKANNYSSSSESESFSSSKEMEPLPKVEMKAAPVYATLGRKPVFTYCNVCRDNVFTTTQKVIGATVWLVFFFLLCTLPIISCLPFILKSWYDVEHYCTKCSRKLGKFFYRMECKVCIFR
ncbi:hypothetical protein SteCoe_31853 [Stentor coeruleus]|uniref:LITAF domain-containing protein n=1 Tax=Stentor coeruleus TaxID=5963 RepID=A0A1R2B0A4_9CILI|nr:hypothetical protein SteCoe_31853 [Stentor coeruleus]